MKGEGAGPSMHEEPWTGHSLAVATALPAQSLLAQPELAFQSVSTSTV